MSCSETFFKKRFGLSIIALPVDQFAQFMEHFDRPAPIAQLPPQYPTFLIELLCARRVAEGVQISGEQKK